MAKKTTSYAPNMGLIGGEARVAASLDNTGATAKAFGDAFSGVIALGVAQNKKRDATINKYIDSIGSVANVSKIEDATNKQQITDFVRGQRDKADVIGRHLERNPDDREARDKLEAIKTSLSTLNTQLEAFTTEKKDYLKIHSDGGLADATTYTAGYYDNAFTNNGMFNIDENGNIGHNIDGTNYLYKDETGKYNVKNQLSIDYLGTAYDTQRNLGKTDEAFDRDQVRRGISKHFNSQEIGTEGIQVMATQDLTEDDTFLLADGVTVAGNMSFRQMWAEGHLKEEFYAGFEKDEATGMYDVGWMTDDAGKDQLVKLMSEYYTDVMEHGHGGGVEIYGVAEKKKTKKEAVATETTRRAGLDQSNAYAVYSSSGDITYKDADEDYAIGDTQISNEEMSAIIGHLPMSSNADRPAAFKLGSDGVLYDKDEATGKWEERVAMQSDSKSKKGRENYNKIIEALQAKGIKDLATTGAVTFEGSKLDYHKKGGGNLKKALNFDRIRWDKGNSGMKQNPILDYRDDDDVAASLTKEFESVGFTFEAVSGGYDKIQAYYNGKKANFVTTTNRNSSDDRRIDEKQLIEWMNAQINADPDWVGEGTGNQYEGNNQDFVQ